MALTEAQHERLAIRNKGMVGYVVLDKDLRWVSERLTTKLSSATAQQKHTIDSVIAMVRTDGALFYFEHGQITGPVLSPEKQQRYISLAKRRKAKPVGTFQRARQPLPRGQFHKRTNWGYTKEE